jgi:hypothetical protein
MDERWHTLARVRDLRARLASNEAARRDQIQARAQAALEQALRLRAHYEVLAEQAGAAASLYATDSGEVCFSAAEAQVLLNYAAGVRLKAQDAKGPVRRAQLVYQHTQAAAEEARENSRRAANRREAVVSRWQEHLRAGSRRDRERRDEMLVEDRSTHAYALRDGDQ